MAKRKRASVLRAGEQDDSQPDALIGTTIHFGQTVEDEDAPRGGTSQVLPVEELPDGWNGEYDNGMQYLYHVRQQASTSPAVVRVDNPYASSAAPSTDNRNGSLLSEHLSAHDYQKPSAETKTTFVEQFKALRQTIRNGDSPPVLDSWYYPIPGDDEAQWRNYINGKKSKGKSAAISSTDDFNSTEGSTPSINVQESGLRLEPKEPSPELLQTIPANLHITILMYLAQWLQERFSPPSTAFVPRRAVKTHPSVSAANSKPRLILPDLDSQWIFSLLSAIDNVLTSEDVSNLRDLGKTCLQAIKLLPDLHKNAPEGKQDLEDQLNGLWMIIGLVSDIWGQKDLWNES